DRRTAKRPQQFRQLDQWSTAMLKTGLFRRGCRLAAVVLKAVAMTVPLVHRHVRRRGRAVYRYPEVAMTEILAVLLARIGANLLEVLIVRLAQALFAAAFRPKAIAVA